MSEQDDRTGAANASLPTEAESAPSATDQTPATASTTMPSTTTQPSDEPRTDVGPPDRGGRPPRFGTILWGVLLLVFAGAMLVTNLTEVRIDPLGWITGAIIATGAVLVVAGIAAAVRRRP